MSSQAVSTSSKLEDKNLDSANCKIMNRTLEEKESPFIDQEEEIGEFSDYQNPLVVSPELGPIRSSKHCTMPKDRVETFGLQTESSKRTKVNTAFG